MCGIAGILTSRPWEDQAALLESMLGTLEHRGPDDHGAARLGACHLGFRRLSIIDPGAESQPFSNETGTVWSVCNGQIYNNQELRAELRDRGHVFRTQVDTEVLPHLWEEHGSDFVHRLNGMFAFAVWDQREQTLSLGRDRAGEKPLFYWQSESQLVFASEIRALLAHPDVSPRLDPLALCRYLMHGFFPAPLSPVAGILKLPAGHLLVGRSGRIDVRRYWDLADHFQPLGASDSRSLDTLTSELDERLSRAVARRSRSDVPFGVFLSGGIDSSAVLSYVAEQQGPGVPAFTLGHKDRSFDEARFARDTARFFEADLHELILDEDDLSDGLERIGRDMDEPLGDASTVSTHLLARLASRHVKVVLSGEGADELFAGYPTYLGNRAAEGFGRLPIWLRRAMIGSIRRWVPVRMGNVGLSFLIHRFISGVEQSRIDRHHRWFGLVPHDQLGSILSPAILERVREVDLGRSIQSPLEGRSLPDALAELLYSDFVLYLQDDLLTKVDRAAMLASLEARAPFLDHELAEFAAGIPSRWKLEGWTTKSILRRTLRSRLPKAVLDRRKRGFNIPFSRWLLHGLGNQLRERFSEPRVRARGLLSYEGVSRLLAEHMNHEADRGRPLFALLVLDLWCDRTFGESAPVPVAEISAPAPSLLEVRA